MEDPRVATRLKRTNTDMLRKRNKEKHIWAEPTLVCTVPNMQNISNTSADLDKYWALLWSTIRSKCIRAQDKSQPPFEWSCAPIYFVFSSMHKQLIYTNIHIIDDQKTDRFEKQVSFFSSSAGKKNCLRQACSAVNRT